jgi:hypothetical protein
VHGVSAGGTQAPVSGTAARGLRPFAATYAFSPSRPGAAALIRGLRSSAYSAAPLFRAAAVAPDPPRPSAHGAELLARVRAVVSARAGIRPTSPPWRIPALGRSRARYLLLPSRPVTAFEAPGSAAWAPSRPSSRTRGLEALADALLSDIAPAAQTPDTRRSYDGPWLAFLAFALAHHAEALVMPAAPQLLQAFISFLVAADLAGAMVRRYLQAIKDQHERRSETFLLRAADLSRWNRAIARHSARPRPPIIPVSAGMVRRLLRLRVDSPELFQDVLATVVCTVTATRPSDLVNIDVCDFLLQYHNDPPGTAAIRIWSSKPDVARKGHFPCIGRATDHTNDVIGRVLHIGNSLGGGLVFRIIRKIIRNSLAYELLQ